MITCDNGLEFISRELEVWTNKHDIHLEFIQPSSLQQNEDVPL